MSLINNLLKDLEKRKKTQTALPYVVFKAKLPQRRFSHKLLWSTIFIVIGLLTLLMLPKTKLPSFPTMLPPQTQRTALAPVIDNEWLKPASIKGIAYQAKDNATILTFFLDHASLYRIAGDPTENKIILTFDHGVLQADLPPFRYLATAIQRVSSHKTADKLFFHLFLKPETTLQQVNLEVDSEKAALVFEFLAKKNDNASENTLLPFNKTPAWQSILHEKYELALRNAENGLYQKAMRELKALLNAYPQYHDARVSLGALLIDQNQMTMAKKVLDQGLRLAPDYLPFLELEARLLSMQGKFKEALNLLLSTTPSIEVDPEYHSLIATLYERSDNDNMAVSLYRRLLTLQPENSGWWMGLAISLEKLGQQTQARNAYTKALLLGHLTPDSIAYAQSRLKLLGEGQNATQ